MRIKAAYFDKILYYNIAFLLQMETFYMSNDKSIKTHYGKPRPGYASPAGVVSTAGEIYETLSEAEGHQPAYTSEMLQAELDSRDLTRVTDLTDLLIKQLSITVEANNRHLEAKRQIAAAEYANKFAETTARYEIRNMAPADTEQTPATGDALNVKRLPEATVKDTAVLRCKGFSIDEVMSNDKLLVAENDKVNANLAASVFRALLNAEVALLRTTDSGLNTARGALNENERKKHNKK